MNNSSINKIRLIKITIAIVIFILVFAGLNIYRNNRNNSKIRSARAAELAAQYEAAAKAKKPTTQIASINAQKLFVLGFYKDYLTNKKSNKSQSETLAKYGTSNLEALINSSTSSYDNLTCGLAVDLSKSSISVGDPIETGTNKRTYLVTFSNSKQPESSMPQATVLTQGGLYRINGVGCLGSI